MQFPCARCGRAYEIADELVVGRAVKVACPACGNLVVHRVPAPGATAAAKPAPPPPSPELFSALADADDDDFDNALSALDGPSSGSGAAAEPEPPPPSSPLSPAKPPPPAPAAPARTSPRPAAAGSAAPKGAAKPPAKRTAPPPSALDLPDDEVPTVTAELVLIRRSARRSRMIAASVALVVIGAVVAGGVFGVRWKRQAPAGAARGASASSDGGAASGGLSAEDLAKLMGRAPEEPQKGAPRTRAQAPVPSDDRPKRKKLASGDKELLDLLSAKKDAAVAVPVEDAGALDTSRGTLDSGAIEGTLSRNSTSFAACVTRAISADPDKRLPVKRVNLELTIRPSGRVAKAAVADKVVTGTPLGDCIAQAAKRMVFPGFDGEPIDIVVPLKLKVGF